MLSARKFKRKVVNKTIDDDLMRRFAAVFHSYKNLDRVTPIAFIARLKKRGVELSSKRRRSTSSQEPKATHHERRLARPF